MKAQHLSEIKHKQFVCLSDTHMRDYYGLPRKFVVTNHYPSGGMYTINVYNPTYKTDNVIVIAKEQKFKVVGTQKEVDDYMAERLESIKQNLTRHLAYGGTIGCDPEIFLQNSDGSVLPAFDFLPSREKPKKTQSGTLFWDGFQAEITTTSTTCLAYQSDRVQKQLKTMYKELRKKNKKADFLAKTVVNITPKMLAESKDEHVAFGCAPSNNVYGMSGKTYAPREINFRPAGGHLHFGLKNLTQKDVENIVRALDNLVGIGCVSLFAKIDDPRRRMMYGLAGEYRLPKHGLEYRTISNAWLFHPLLMHMVFDLARKAVVLGYKDLLDVLDYDDLATIEIINSHDVEGARKWMKKNSIIIKRIMSSYVGGAHHYVDLCFRMWMQGAETFLLDYTNVKRNWHLDDGVVWNSNASAPRVKFYSCRSAIADGQKV